MSAMMSTLPHVYKSVPRQPLIDALTPLGPLYRTDDLAPAALFEDVRASTADVEPFAPA
jgi:hypothetical protein